jgi:hypothetical protein
MKTFWADPYLWIHGAGIAAVPFWLVLCFLGLGAGDPLFPSAIELLIIAIVGIGPIVWMQWEKPFCIYSLLAVSLKSANLTENQRKMLALFQQRRNPIVIAMGAGLMFLLLKAVNDHAAIAAPITPIPNHGLGLLVAAVSFLAANLFLQVPLAVGQVMLASDSDFQAASPIAANAVGQQFFEPGLKVDRLLPDIED